MDARSGHRPLGRWAALAGPSDDDLRVVLVAGAEEARDALLGNVNAWATWHPLLDPAHDRLGASWLPAGSYDWSDDPNTYTPEIGARILEHAGLRDIAACSCTTSASTAAVPERAGRR